MKGEYKVCSLEEADVFARKRALGKGPLSEEEINKLYLEHGNSEWGWQIKFARAIEERHGIACNFMENSCTFPCKKQGLRETKG